MKRLIKVFKNRTVPIVLFIVVLMAAFIYFNPESTHAGILVVKHQRVSLIIETSYHRNLSDDLSSSDIYISKNDESSSDDGENDDDEEDDDWEA